MSNFFVGRMRNAICELFKGDNDSVSVYQKYFTLKGSFYETREAMPLVIKFRWVNLGNRNFSYEDIYFRKSKF